MSTAAVCERKMPLWLALLGRRRVIIIVTTTHRAPLVHPSGEASCQEAQVFHPIEGSLCLS